MKDKGYKDTAEEARMSSSNQLGLSRPMLAHPIARVANINYTGAVQQKKLNGHRCLVTMVEGKAVAYSRQGKPITSIDHLLEHLEPHLDEGTTLDGELYCHGEKLQTLASWIKREQADTVRLSYVVYDIISDERYQDRHLELSNIVSQCSRGQHGYVMTLPYEEFTSLENLYARRDQVISAGFEGMMLRLDGRGYEEGKRSSSLLKVKKFNDAEFIVIDIIPSADGWGICVCLTDGGKQFKVSAPGDMEEKTAVLKHKDINIGRLLTVEYAELTDDGIPFHCSAKQWRDDV